MSNTVQSPEGRLALKRSLADTVRDYLLLLGGAGLVVAADQWSKVLVRARLAPGDQWVPWSWLEPFARIVNSSNTGAAFGIFPDRGLVFTVVAVLVSVAILYYFPQVPVGQWPVRLALALQLGGALGNLTDRLLQGGEVTDFISVGRFPVFNIADSSISIGVAILVVTMIIEERRAKRHPSEDQESDPEASAAEASNTPG